MTVPPLPPEVAEEDLIYKVNTILDSQRWGVKADRRLIINTVVGTRQNTVLLTDFLGLRQNFFCFFFWYPKQCFLMGSGKQTGSNIHAVEIRFNSVFKIKRFHFVKRSMFQIININHSFTYIYSI